MSFQKSPLPGTFTLERIANDEEKKINDFFRAYQKLGKIRVNPGGWFLLEPYLAVAHSIYNFKFLPSDVVVMTFPKCGTMWMIEIVWTMRHNPNLSNPRAQDVINDRSDMIELDMFFETSQYEETNPKEFKEFKKMFPEKDAKEGMFVHIFEIEKTKKVLKTHLPFCFYKSENLDRCKVIYVARNVRDVVLSFYDYSRLMKNADYVGNLEQFLNFFMEGKLFCCPYWKHVKEAWQRKDQPNVHFVFYEDLRANPEEEIRRLDKFLETNLDDQQIKNVVNYTSFENMKKRDTHNIQSGSGLYQEYMNVDLLEKEGGFYRTGRVGSWKQVTLSKEQEEQFSKWIAENERAIGITFKYE